MTTTNNTEKAVRITKANRFEDIKALLLGEEVKFNTTIGDAVEFINKEMDLLARKNSKKSNGEPTEAQKENEEYKRLIIEYLGGLASEENGEGGATCSDMIKNIPAFYDFNTSKISSLTSALIKEGRIVRLKTRKGRTPFALA